MTKLEFLVRAFVAHNEQLKTLADNQGELLGAIIELKNRGEWVGLTDEEIDRVDEATWDEDHTSWGPKEFARAIEAKLKEKNGW